MRERLRFTCLKRPCRSTCAMPEAASSKAGDVDDGADQARHLAVGAVEGRLVVDRAARPVAGRDLDLVALAAGPLPELVVHRQMLGGDPWALRIQVGDLLADEVLARDAEELFPRPVDAEVAAVARLEEDRHRQHVDQLLREALRLGQVAARLGEDGEHRMREAAARRGGGKGHFKPLLQASTKFPLQIIVESAAVPHRVSATRDHVRFIRVSTDHAAART